VDAQTCEGEATLTALNSEYWTDVW